MNNERRKVLKKALISLQETSTFADEVAKIMEKLLEAKELLEEVLAEEQDYLDNMPEGLQNSDRGSVTQDTISELENAINDLDTVHGALEESADQITNIVSIVEDVVNK